LGSSRATCCASIPISGENPPAASILSINDRPCFKFQSRWRIEIEMCPCIRTMSFLTYRFQCNVGEGSSRAHPSPEKMPDLSRIRGSAEKMSMPCNWAKAYPIGWGRTWFKLKDHRDLSYRSLTEGKEDCRLKDEVSLLLGVGEHTQEIFETRGQSRHNKRSVPLHVLTPITNVRRIMFWKGDPVKGCRISQNEPGKNLREEGP
jgi:hypothetical protein